MSDTDLRETISSLRADNERLRARVAELEIGWKHCSPNEPCLRCELDAALAAAEGDDTPCLAHPHKNRVEEAVCALRFQRDTAYSEAVTAGALVMNHEGAIARLTRERDAAREDCRVMADGLAQIHEDEWWPTRTDSVALAAAVERWRSKP